MKAKEIKESLEKIKEGYKTLVRNEIDEITKKLMRLNYIDDKKNVWYHGLIYLNLGSNYSMKGKQLNLMSAAIVRNGYEGVIVYYLNNKDKFSNIPKPSKEVYNLIIEMRDLYKLLSEV